MPTAKPTVPVLPNFFLETKGPHGHQYVALKQACFYGAHGVRAMHVLQNHGLETPSYDGIARTFTAVYQQGMLTIHAHHATAPSFKGTQPDYHMTQIGAFALTHSVESYIAGVTAFRNVRDIAVRYRDEVIADAKNRL
jgi:hypothetical protein